MKTVLWISAAVMIIVGLTAQNDTATIIGSVFVAAYSVCKHIDRRLAAARMGGYEG